MKNVFLIFCDQNTQRYNNLTPMEHIYQRQGIWLHWFLDMVIVWQPLTSHGTYLSKTGNLVTLVPGYGDCLAAT
jgi:hypothetical protein